MAYLLDANVSITAKRDHYRFATFPTFWTYLQSGSPTGAVLSIADIERELLAVNDDLATWVRGCRPRGLFVPLDAGTTTAAPRVTIWVEDVARPYTRAAKDQFFRVADFWLISHALAHGHTVVTHEVPAPTAKRSVKIPDVCNALNVRWTNPFQMLEELGAVTVQPPAAGF